MLSLDTAQLGLKRMRTLFIITDNRSIGYLWFSLGAITITLMTLFIGVGKESMLLHILEAFGVKLGFYSANLVSCLFVTFLILGLLVVTYFVMENGPYSHKEMLAKRKLGGFLLSLTDIVALFVAICLRRSLENGRHCYSWISFVAAFQVIGQLQFGYCDFEILHWFIGVLMQALVTCPKDDDLLSSQNVFWQFVLCLAVIYHMHCYDPSSMVYGAPVYGLPIYYATVCPEKENKGVKLT